MFQENTQNFNRLIAAVAEMPEVMSVGKSGSAALPKAGEGDIDIFVFCDTVPGIQKRQAAAESLDVAFTEIHLSASPGKHWGTCDYVFFGGMEVCLMYFPIAGIDAEMESTLSGARPNREDNYFYPTGRCASFVTMHILCDKQGYLAAMQKRLRVYPETLAARLIRYHLEALKDPEDLERAVSRKDALFYHFALDLALDHFLQALFALNRCYFPSRMRTVLLIESFSRKPERCAERILEAVALGASGGTLSQSYQEFSALCRELAALSRRSLALYPE